MTTIASEKGMTVRTNGRTYFVSDSAGQCRLATSSKRKAINCMNRILKDTNA